MDTTVTSVGTSSHRKIFDVPVYDMGWHDALSMAEDLAMRPSGQTLLAFVNAHNILLTLSDPEYREILLRSIVLPDGIGLDIASSVEHGSAFPANLNGTDFVPAFLTYMQRPRRVGLIGATREIVEKAAANFAKHAPWHLFFVISDGYFDKNNPAPVLAEIERQKLDIILIGMGTPLQEKWAVDHLKPEHARLVMTVGALFDFVSGIIPRAPYTIRLLRLEWAYRLLQEPYRLWRRYILGIPLFFFEVLRHRFRRVCPDETKPRVLHNSRKLDRSKTNRV
ncbi:WecB/TagA/CpsF family glycosyltransferase [Oryzifoliimicrobium ureilyticus]|uniref:WecB/TagA/CpsF family glycosyltransferase n=1 Tax=Oryzifoliimicrobium ureilyticus TaxID=3113724 RepID=UPI00307647A2